MLCQRGLRWKNINYRHVNQTWSGCSISIPCFGQEVHSWLVLEDVSLTFSFLTIYCQRWSLLLRVHLHFVVSCVCFFLNCCLRFVVYCFMCNCICICYMLLFLTCNAMFVEHWFSHIARWFKICNIYIYIYIYISYLHINTHISHIYIYMCMYIYLYI